jgi:hypothetical protein
LEEGEETGQPDDQGYRRQFHDALRDRGQIQTRYLVQRIVEKGDSVLSGSKPNEDRKANYLEKALQDEHPTNVRGARVNGLVDERRSPPEISQIPNGDVLGIRAFLIQLWQGC